MECDISMKPSWVNKLRRRETFHASSSRLFLHLMSLLFLDIFFLDIFSSSPYMHTETVFLPKLYSNLSGRDSRIFGSYNVSNGTQSRAILRTSYFSHFRISQT